MRFVIEPGWGRGGHLLGARGTGFTAGIAQPARPIDVAPDDRYVVGVSVDLTPPTRSRPPLDVELRFAAFRSTSPMPAGELVAATVRRIAGQSSSGPAPEIVEAPFDLCQGWGADAAGSVMLFDGKLDTMEELHALARSDLGLCIVISKRAKMTASISPEHFNHFQAWINSSIDWQPGRRTPPPPIVFGESFFLAPGPHLVLRPERIAELDGLAGYIAGNVSGGGLLELRDTLYALAVPVLYHPFEAAYVEPIASALAAAAPPCLTKFFRSQLSYVRNLRDFSGLQYYWLKALARVLDPPALEVAA